MGRSPGPRPGDMLQRRQRGLRDLPPSCHDQLAAFNTNHHLRGQKIERDKSPMCVSSSCRGWKHALACSRQLGRSGQEVHSSNRRKRTTSDWLHGNAPCPLSLCVRDHAAVSTENFLLFHAAMPPSMLATLDKPFLASPLAAMLDRYPLPHTQTIGRFFGSPWA